MMGQAFIITCQPTPRLKMEGGNIVALANLDTAMKAPVDCSNISLKKEPSTLNRRTSYCLIKG
jgi:hypothetical protein